jgi:hypothetical protein
MHFGYKALVKIIRGIVEIDDSQYQIQKYMQKYVIVNKKILEKHGCT